MGSGGGKDKSINILNRAFQRGYEELNARVLANNIKEAKKLSKEKHKSEKYWKKYFVKPHGLVKEDVNSTPEGMLLSMNKIQKDRLGSYCATSSELGSDLQSSINLPIILKQLAVGYDLGNITSKTLRGEENQLDNIKNLNINSLMFSSINSLTKSVVTRDRFINFMLGAGARRSLMIYVGKDEGARDFDSLEEFDSHYKKEYERKEESYKKLNSYVEKLTKLIPTGKEIKLSEEARVVFNRFQSYGTSIAKAEKFRRYKMTQLSIQHRYWMALKLSGILAMSRGKMVIHEQDYLQALGLVLKFIEDVSLFQNEVEKEPYERLIDYCIEFNEKGKLSLSKHKLLKEGFVTKSELTKPKLEALFALATEADSNGLYQYSKKDGGRLAYKQLKPPKVSSTIPEERKAKIEATDSHRIAIKEFTISDKDSRVANCSDGYENRVYSFKDLKSLLVENTAYNNYHFKNGVRSKSTLVNKPTKIFILDVDKSTLDIYQMHNLLIEYRHHISTTSNKV